MRIAILSFFLLIVIPLYGQNNYRVIKGIYYINGSTKVPVSAKIYTLDVNSTDFDNGRLFLDNRPDTIRCDRIVKIRIEPEHYHIYKPITLDCNSIKENVSLTSFRQSLGTRNASWASSFEGKEVYTKIVAFEPDSLIGLAVRKILGPLGLEGLIDENRITIEASPISNAQAAIVDGKAYIFYNPVVAEKILNNDWGIIGLFAHELAHHIFLQSTNSIENKNDSTFNHKLELEADEWAGFILGHLDTDTTEAFEMIKLLSSNTATYTHPGKDVRKKRILKGWNRGVENKINSKINKKYLIHENRSKKLFAQKEFLKAKLELDTAIGYNPYSDDLYSSRSDCFNQLGDLNNAVSDANKSLEINPQNKTALQIRVWANLIANNLYQSEIDLKKLSELDSGKILTFFYGFQSVLKRDYSKALSYYNQAIEMDSLYFIVYEYRGKLYEFLNQNENAEKDFTFLLSKHPNHPKPLIINGDFKFKLQKFEEAISFYSRAIAADTANSLTFYQRGYAYMKWAMNSFPFKQEYLEKSKEDYLSAIKKHPQHLEAMYNLATTLKYLGKLDSAINILNRLIELNPIPLNYYERGISYIFKEEYSKAITDFDVALKSDPSFKLALHAKGVSKMLDKNYVDAIDDFNMVLSTVPNWAASKFGIALCYFELGKYPESLNNYLSLKSMTGLLTTSDIVFKNINHYNNLEALISFSISEIYGELNDTSNQLEYLNKTIDAFDEYSEAYYNRGLIYYFEDLDSLSNMDFYRAIELSEKEYNESIPYPTLLFRIAKCYSYLEDYKKALHYINKSIEQSISFSINTNFLFKEKAQIHYYDGDYKNAIYELKKLDLGHEDSYSFYTLGKSYYFSKKYKEAIVHLDSAIKYDNVPLGGYYYFKGRSYHKLNNFDEACAAYRLAKDLNYSAKNLDSYISKTCK